MVHSSGVDITKRFQSVAAAGRKRPQQIAANKVVPHSSHSNYNQLHILFIKPPN